MEGKSLEEMSSIQLTGTSTVPPGFRFHPTDEELVGYYLTKKVACSKIDLDVIREIDLYKLEPWDLQERCRIGSAEQHEWYFFSHKDKKYPTGTRTNRATTAGFWKATGRDKPIFAKVKLIGMRKTLVFYKGRAPNGQKSDWIMHEYRLEDDINNTATNEEGWVVCRVFKKRNIVKKPNSDYDGGCYDEELSGDKVSSSTTTTSTQFINNTNSNNFVKQELENGGIYFPFAYDSFSQLPRLESPKRSSCEVSASSPLASSSAIEDQSNVNNNTVRNLCSDSQFGHLNELEELVQLQSKAFMPQPDHFHAFNEDLVAAWGMDDRIPILTAAEEDEFSKDTTRFLAAGSLSAELSQRMGKGQHHQHQNQQVQQPDYSYDVDLWGFNR